jgi:hypothetical protein
MRNIIKYSNTHKNTLLAALSAQEAGIGLLNNVQEKLRFASDELQRMENESGIPLNDEQTAKLNAYFKATSRIRKVLPFAQKMVAPSQTTALLATA